MGSVDLPLSLEPDCGSCFALCCTALGFERSTDFAIDKPAGEPCPNLSAEDFGCTIHAELVPRGFRGCTAFGCFGAGQHVAQGTFGGQSWRAVPGSAPQMYAVFIVMRQLHEYLWHLTEARRVAPDQRLQGELDDAVQEMTALTQGPAAALAELDVESLRPAVDARLAAVSVAVRATVPAHSPHRALRRRPDLIGAQLGHADLRGADLRGVYLIGADLTGADLRLADLLGADLRGAELAGADLSTCLFLTPMQLGSARGSRKTRLPRTLARPDSW